MSSSFHAAPWGKAWNVRRTNNKRAWRVGLTRDAAWQMARELAKRHRCRAFLFGADGRIETVENFEVAE